MSVMKRIVFNLLIVLLPCSFLIGQDDETTITPLTEAGENLDLQAVMELFDNSTLEIEEYTD